MGMNRLLQDTSTEQQQLVAGMRGLQQGTDGMHPPHVSSGRGQVQRAARVTHRVAAAYQQQRQQGPAGSCLAVGRQQQRLLQPCQV